MRTGIVLLCAAAALLAESAAGLKWTAPPGWASQGSAPMRAVTYAIPAAAGSGKAECVVYFFGQGQGGSVDANIARWKTQFVKDGKPAEAKIEKRTIHGVPVTTVNIAGTFTASGGLAATQTSPESNYQMLAAIAEGPGGNIFIRLAGPAKTVEANVQKFDQLLNSLEKQ